MPAMTPRERIVAALDHRSPDRVPLDVGGCDASSIVAAAYEQLKAHLGIESETVFLNRRSGVVKPDEAVLRRLGAATRIVILGQPDDMPERWEPDGTVIDQ